MPEKNSNATVISVLRDTGHQYFSILNFEDEKKESTPWKSVDDLPWIRWRYERGRAGTVSADGSDSGEPHGRYLVCVETNTSGDDARGTLVDEVHVTGVLNHSGGGVNALEGRKAFAYAGATGALKKDSKTTFSLEKGVEVQLDWDKVRNDKWVPVDVVVDFGNSRTSALMLEPPGDSPRLVKMISPVYFLPQGWSRNDVVADIFEDKREYCIPDSWLVLREGPFAAWPLKKMISESEAFAFNPDAREKTVTRVLAHGFVEVSPAVIGGAGHPRGARNLVVSQASNIRGRRVMQSSPKRYAWDDGSELVLKKRHNELWHMIANDAAFSAAERRELDLEAVPELDGLIRYVMSAENPALPFGKQGLRLVVSEPSYSRADTLCWYALGILEAAWRQINSREHRSFHGNADCRRYLRNVRISSPGVWSFQERERFRVQWERALELFTKLRWNRGQWQKSPQKNASDDSGRCPNLIMDRLDETVAGQLPVVFSELRYLGNMDLWFDLYGCGDKPSNVRVAHLDIGGGTSDIAVIDYLHPLRTLDQISKKNSENLEESERAFLKFLSDSLQEFDDAGGIPGGGVRDENNDEASKKAAIIEVLTRMLEGKRSGLDEKKKKFIENELRAQQGAGAGGPLPFFVAFRGGSTNAGDLLLKEVVERCVIPAWIKKSYADELSHSNESVQKAFREWLGSKDDENNPLRRLETFFLSWQGFEKLEISEFCERDLQIVVRLVFEPIAKSLLASLRDEQDPKNVDTSVCVNAALDILNRIAFRSMLYNRRREIKGEEFRLAESFRKGVLAKKKEGSASNSKLNKVLNRFKSTSTLQQFEKWFKEAKSELNEFLPFQPNVKLEVSRPDLIECVRHIFDPLFDSLAPWMRGADLVVLSGKISEIPMVRDEVVKRSGLDPLRVVAALGFPCGQWYPNHRDGRVDDAKTVSVCGSALYHASDCRWLGSNEHRLVDLGGVRTRHYWGKLSTRACKNNQEFYRLIDDDDQEGECRGLFSPKVGRDEVSMKVGGGELIGKTLSASGDLEPTPVYEVLRKNIERENPRTEIVCFRRKFAEDGVDYLELDSKHFYLAIRPLPSGSFWMDEPLLNLKIHDLVDAGPEHNR